MPRDERGPLRVTLLLGTLQIGGTERQVTQLACALAAAGHDVEVVCLSGDGPLSTELDRAGVPWRVIGWTGFRIRGADGKRRLSVLLDDVRPCWELVRHLRERRPDVVHSFLFWANVVGMPAATIAGVRGRVSGRRSLVGMQGGPQRFPGRWITTRLANGASRLVVANSSAVASDLRQAERVRARKLAVVPNGVALPTEVAPVGDDPAVGVVVANLKPGKGHAHLLEALALLDRRPRISFLGDGRLRGELERRAAELGVTDAVVFTGQVDDVGAHLAGAQFAVLPSESEGFPNGVLEAMAHGLPVIATTVGGIPELVEHEVEGLLVPPGRPDLLAVALDRLAAEPALRNRLGRAARARAESLSWDRCVDRHLRLYRQLAGAA